MYATWISIIWTILFFSVAPSRAIACDPADGDAQEILLELQVENLLTFDLDGFLCGDTLYLPVSVFFSRLNVDHSFSSGQRRLDVDFPDNEGSYRFDFTRLRVRSAEGTIGFDEHDLFHTEDRQEVHLSKELLEEIFSLDIHFDYSSLRVLLFSQFELPVIRDYRRRVRYENFQPSQREFAPDKEYSAQRHLLNGWVLDWTLNSSHSIYRQNYAYGFAAGGQLLGGDLFFSSRGTAADGIRRENLRGQWRYPIYSTPVIRQVVAGDQMQDNLFSRGTLQFRGVEITNSPNAPRQHFHEFRISDHLQEGWDVELYTNNRMTGLARSKETDSFSFSKPMRYGSNRFTLRHYSPEGFSHEETFFMTIPRTFLPSGSFEYSLSAGSYRFDSEEFARAQINMGVSSFLTVGGGYHVMSDHSSDYEQTPYLNTSLQLANRLILEGSHTFGHTTEGSLRYYFLNGRSLSADARTYYGQSRFNQMGKEFEGSLNASFPLNLGSLRLSTFVTARGTRYTRHQDLNLFSGFTAGLPFGFLLQLRSKMMFRDNQAGQFERVRSDMSITASKRVLRRLLLRPGLDYNHSTGRISGYRLEASSRLFSHGDVSLSVHRDQLLDQYRFQFSFRYNLPFARYHSQARTTGSGNPSFSQTASGSLALDTNQRDLHTDNRTMTGKASLRLEPYLVMDDLDGEDPVRESADQMNADVYVNGHEQPTYREGDVIKNLIPYEEYVVQVDAGNLDNPLWRLESETFRIQVIPHVMNRLPIPVIAMGEVSGRVEMTGDDTDISLRGLTVELNETGGSFSETVETYSNGRFYYVGLKPGEYKAVLDTDQISARSMNVVHDSVAFTIRATQQGDIVDGLTLGVTPDVEESLTEIYTVQVGAFRQIQNAIDLAEYMKTYTSIEVEILYDPEDRLYRCRIGFFDSEEAAWELLRELQRDHTPRFRDAFIIRHEL